MYQVERKNSETIHDLYFFKHSQYKLEMNSHIYIGSNVYLISDNINEYSEESEYHNENAFVEIRLISSFEKGAQRTTIYSFR